VAHRANFKTPKHHTAFQALTLTAIGLVIGLLLGGIVARIYDRGYHRIPAGTATPSLTSTTDTDQ